MRTIAKNKLLQDCVSKCKEQGFVKDGANYYRLFGEGLIQVVTLNGFPERTSLDNYSREPAVCFAVYSAFSDIYWNPCYMKPRRALVPNIFPGLVAPGGNAKDFLGTALEAVRMRQYVLPFLNELTTHEKMVDLYNTVDSSSDKCSRIIDCNRIVPYVLAGEIESALDMISRIETQNWEAFHDNCLTAKRYDAVKQQSRIEQNLAPLQALRKTILEQDAPGIWDILQRNYHANISVLQSMGVPHPQDFSSKIKERLNLII